MHLKRANGEIMLWIDQDVCISFRDTWIENLSTLQYEKYGEYIKSKIYPSLDDGDRKIWNRNTISNKDLQEAIVTFTKV